MEPIFDKFCCGVDIRGVVVGEIKALIGSEDSGRTARREKRVG